MNYINKLQEDNAELRSELKSAYSMALELKIYAMSPKFMGESGYGGKTYMSKEDVIRFDHGDRTFAVYRSPEDEYYATDGLCTHEKIHLADGLMMDNVIECPKHNGRFDYTDGSALGAPVCENLQTYLVKVEDGQVFINI